MANHKRNSGGKNGSSSRSAPRKTSTHTRSGATTPPPPRSTPTAGAPSQYATAPRPTSTTERKPTAITRQQIAEAAYFLWKQRGGSEVSNWLEAERQLNSSAITNF